MTRNDEFGAYLLKLRRNTRLSLRDVEMETDNAISNGYLSLIETGRRPPPQPAVLVRLARLYNVPSAEMLQRAGYLEGPSDSDIDVAFQQVLADGNFKFGTRAYGDLTVDAKRTIVELYEQATNKILLPPREDAD